MDLTPILKDNGTINRDALFWHYPHYNRHPHSFPSSLIRKGDWKLIENLNTGGLELYNLVEDVGETNNLATSKPGKATELLADLNAWRTRVGADPMRPNPNYE